MADQTVFQFTDTDGDIITVLVMGDSDEVTRAGGPLCVRVTYSPAEEDGQLDGTAYLPLVAVDALIEALQPYRTGGLQTPDDIERFLGT